jgi:cell shape-determining protein MreD
VWTKTTAATKAVNSKETIEMELVYQLLGIALQIAGFVYLCRLGGRLSDRLYARSEWAPVMVAGPIIVALVAVALIFHPALTFVTQTIGFWLIAFAGGIAVRAQERYTGD